MDLSTMTDDELQALEDQINEEQAKRFAENLAKAGKQFLDSNTLMDFLRSRRK